MNTSFLKPVLATALMMSGVADARGLLVDPSALPDDVRVELAREIAAAKQANPDAFERVARVVAEVERMDASKRGRLAPVAAILRRLGNDALWPMVEWIAFDGTSPTDVPSARATLDAALVEAAGMRRDPRVAPVWKAILGDPSEQRLLVLRAAVGALARLETDDAARTLITLAKGDGVRREAALGMMGHCRRLSVAKALADALDARPSDVAEVKRIASALADVGNSWAWRTPEVKAQAEEGAVRQTAAEALLRAYLHYDGEARQAALHGILVVDAPNTELMIEAAKKRAGEGGRAALETLQARYAKNPTR